jgi:phosphoribosylformylglycinamidine synthase subunit PurL
VGAEPVAVTDCLNFGSPEKPDGYYQLAKCIEGMSEACEVLGTPVVSGNVSLYNETDRGPIYPTPTVGMVGILEDVNRHATPAFKREGDMVVVIGSGSPLTLAGSDYLQIVHGRVAGKPPNSDLISEKEVADLLCSMVRSGLVDTVHDISGGGEIVAVTEMALAGGVGIEYTDGEFERKIAGQGGGRTDVALFGEEFGAFVVAVPWERWAAFQAAVPGNIGYDQIGTVGGDRLTIPGLIDLGLDELRKAYDGDLFEAHAPEGGHFG